jgi:hypothetical protein
MVCPAHPRIIPLAGTAEDFRIGKKQLGAKVHSGARTINYFRKDR